MPKGLDKSYGSFVPVRDMSQAVTRPPRSATPTLPTPDERTNAAFGWVDRSSGHRSAQFDTDRVLSGPPTASSGRKRMPRTASALTATSNRTALCAVGHEAVRGALITTPASLSFGGLSALSPKSATSQQPARLRALGQMLRALSTSIAKTLFVASPPPLRTGAGSLPLDRRDAEAGYGPTSSPWPTKCSLMHPIPRRLGLWCCAATA